MKTIVHIETDDEAREKIARTLGLEDKLVSRKQLNEAAQQFVAELIDPPTEPSNEVTESLSTESPSAYEGEAFVPSRGDEPYLYKAKDPKLRQIHSEFLNVVDKLDSYVWNEMEKNRA